MQYVSLPLYVRSVQGSLLFRRFGENRTEKAHVEENQREHLTRVFFACESGLAVERRAKIQRDLPQAVKHDELEQSEEASR